MLSISLLLLISCFTITILSTSLLYPFSIAIAQQPTYPDVDSPTNNNVQPDPAAVGPSVGPTSVGPRPVGPSVGPFDIPTPTPIEPTPTEPTPTEPTSNPDTDLENPGSETDSNFPPTVSISSITPWVIVGAIAMIIVIAVGKSMGGQKARKIDIPPSAHVDIKTKGGIS